MKQQLIDGSVDQLTVHLFLVFSLAGGRNIIAPVGHIGNSAAPQLEST